MRILASATTALRRIVDLGLVVLIVLTLFGVVLGKGAPLIGRQSIVIGGGSMEPAIGLGSAIIVKPVDPASLAVGDVVSMQIGPERTTYTHRIVALVDRADGRWIRTQGDANAEPDPSLVSAGAVIGRVELAIPLAGYLLALLSLPMGVMFVLGLAATLLAIAWLLESIGSEPRPARHRAAGTGEPDPALTTLPASTALASMLAVDPGGGSGEPIAARPIGGLVPAGSFQTRRWALPGPVLAPAVGSPARPSVRVQIERNREVRRRRSRWQQLSRGDRPASE